MPVTVILELHLKPETADEVIDGLQISLRDTRAYDGCLSVGVRRDQDDRAHLALVERWRDRAAQEAYLAWRQETGSLAQTVAASTAPPTITYYDELPEAS